MKESFSEWVAKGRPRWSTHHRLQAKAPKQRTTLSIRPALGDGSQVLAEGDRLVTVYPCGHRHSMPNPCGELLEKMVSRWQNSGAGFNVAPCSTCWRKGIYSQDQQALLKKNRVAYKTRV